MARPKVVPRVVEAILKKLAAEEWLPGSRLPSARTLAADFAVSKGTVQAALRSVAQMKVVSAVPRKRAVVLPNAVMLSRRRLARLAHRSANRRLAILVPAEHVPIKDPFYTLLIRDLIVEAARRGIRAGIEALPLDGQLRAARALPQRGFHAALCVAFGPAHLPAVLMMLDQKFPVATFNRRLPGLEAPSVRIDDYQSSQRIAHILYDRGHRDLCMVAGILAASAWSGTGRTAGWVECLREMSLLKSCSMPLYILPPYSGTSPFSPSFADQMHSPRRPTAMVFCGARHAEEFLTDPRFRDLHIADDLSVVVAEPGRQAFAVSDLPPLTTIQIDLVRTAQCCLEMIETLLGGHLNPPSIRVAEQFVLTESIGPAPQMSGRTGVR